MTQDFTYHTQLGYTIKGTIYGMDLPPTTPNILYVHGFKGFKDWGFVPPSGEFFVEQGFRFIAFNFSHNGIGEDPVTFTELEKFKNNTFSLEIMEAMEIAEQIRAGTFFEIDKDAFLGMIGHSRGGGVGVCATAWCVHIDALATWNAISSFNRYSEVILDEWRTKGYMEVINSRTGQVFQMGMPILQDLLCHRNNFLNIQLAAKNLEVPLCIIQGDADEAVHPDNAQRVFSWAENNATEMHILPGAGHTFNAKHPFDGTTPELESAWNHTLKFFQGFLQD